MLKRGEVKLGFGAVHLGLGEIKFRVVAFLKMDLIDVVDLETIPIAAISQFLCSIVSAISTSQNLCKPFTRIGRFEETIKFKPESFGLGINSRDERDC